MDASPDTLRVSVVVYDLLPPGKVGWLLNTVGAGIYHSSVSISIPIGPTDVANCQPREWAFGGHYEPGATGIFAVPEGTAAARMPGLRYYLTHDLGGAFGPEWHKVFGPKLERRSVLRDGGVVSRTTSRSTTGEEKGLGSVTPVYEQVGNAQSTSHLELEPDVETHDSYRDPDPEDWLKDDDGTRDGTQYLSKAQRRAWRIIEAMKAEPEWEGTKYSLLERNCNTFTDELVWRLTGRRAPSYLNRAAWFATSAPCLIPAGWIDEPEDTPSSSSPPHANVVVVPPRADQMSFAQTSARH